MDTHGGLVIPSSFRSYTGLVERLAALNPPLAQDVINVINHVDRTRGRMFQQVMGPVDTRQIWRTM